MPLEGQHLACGALAQPGTICDLTPVGTAHRLSVLDAQMHAEPGALELHHVPEPPHPAHIDKPEHWSLWLRDEKLAEWDHDPR